MHNPTAGGRGRGGPSPVPAHRLVDDRGVHDLLLEQVVLELRQAVPGVVDEHDLLRQDGVHVVDVVVHGGVPAVQDVHHLPQRGGGGAGRRVLEAAAAGVGGGGRRLRPSFSGTSTLPSGWHTVGGGRRRRPPGLRYVISGPGPVMVEGEGGA